MPKIVILGAGISGLSLGWYLKKQLKNSSDLTIVEANQKAHGWIKTIDKEGFLFELGPRSCRTEGNGIKTLQLIEELKLMDQVILADPSQKNRYIYKNQELVEIPRGMISFLRSPLKSSLFFALCRDFFLGKRLLPNGIEDESIDEFATRRFGSEIAKSFFDPMTSGIYAGDTTKLSLKSCFPVLYNMEREWGSIVKGMFLRKSQKDQDLSPFVKQNAKETLFSFKKGMQTLTDDLSDKLQPHLLLSTEVTKLDIRETNTTIHFKHRPPMVADYVFSTLPAHILKELVHLQPLKKGLENFQSTSVAVVSLGFKSEVMSQKGFGYLVPSSEQEEILGVVFDSSIFKEQNRNFKTRLTVMIGGAHFTNFDRYRKEDFLKIALKAINKHLKVTSLPDVSHVEVAKNAISQYLIGHEKRVRALEEMIPSHVKILGSSFFGVSVNDCIATSRFTAENF